MRLPSRTPTLVVVATFLVLLTGCSGGDNGTSSAASDAAISADASNETSEPFEAAADARADAADADGAETVEASGDASQDGASDAASDSAADASSEATLGNDASIPIDAGGEGSVDAAVDAATDAHADASEPADANAADGTDGTAPGDAAVQPDSTVGDEAAEGRDATVSGEDATGNSQADAGDASSTLTDEVGFIDVPRQNTAATYPARMFYVFEVADSEPAQKPLAVFFNGGPGFATSLGLLSYGTARYTLDQANPDAGPTLNPASWTSFANLLYIDERQVGFSYGLDPDGGLDWLAMEGGTYGVDSDGGPCTFAPVEDAADFVRTILRFLDAHPALQAAPVILVGESYGGTRGTYILDLLLRYTTEAARADSSLQAEIQAHYDAIFPSEAGTTIDVALAKTQFGRAVFIQPLVAGDVQYDEEQSLIGSDPYLAPYFAAGPLFLDPYDIQKDAGWSDGLDKAAATALSEASNATLLLTQDPRAIPRLGPSARTTAFRILPADPENGMPAANTALAALVGPLRPQDDYVMEPSSACATPFDVIYSQVGSGDEFLSNLQAGVSTFITNARYDAVIYSPAIPALIAAHTSDTVATDPVPDSGVARPGGFTVTFAMTDGGSPSADVRFPPYTSSGHMVAITQPQDLHDDVVEWIAQTAR
ncbi:MAG: hypothetical protein ABTD50_22045 [Polyangiaceae bacterium]|jgi:hypothetical protein